MWVDSITEGKDPFKETCYIHYCTHLRLVSWWHESRECESCVITCCLMHCLRCSLVSDGVRLLLLPSCTETESGPTVRLMYSLKGRIQKLVYMIRISLYLCVCVRAHARVCVHVCMCVCMCVTHTYTLSHLLL